MHSLPCTHSPQKVPVFSVVEDNLLDKDAVGGNGG